MKRKMMAEMEGDIQRLQHALNDSTLRLQEEKQRVISLCAENDGLKGACLQYSIFFLF